jgi:hypothetical protein
MVKARNCKLSAAGCAVLVLCLMFLLTTGVSSATEYPFQAGAAAVVVTPTAAMMDPAELGPVYLGGYGQGRIADPGQVWDDLWARTLVIRRGDTAVAFTAVDSVGIFYHDALRIHELARESLLRLGGITLDHIIVSASHTHHAPDTMGMWGPSLFKSGINPHYQEYLIEQTAESIVQAASSLQPVSEVRFGIQDTAGLIRDTREPVVIDENIYVMHLTGTDEQTIATLVKWDSHPETVLGFYNEAITSDYVHYLRQTVEDAVGGMALFFVGSIGGLPTSLRVDVGYGTDKEASIPTTISIGEQAGEAALHAIRNSEPSTIAEIVVTRKEIFLPMENHLFYLAGLLGVLERDLYHNGRLLRRKPLPPQLGGPTAELHTEVSVVTMGEAQFVMIPGELYPEIALGGYLAPELAHNPDAHTEPVLMEHMAGRYNFIIGLANDEIGYIIPANDFVPLQGLGAGEHRISGKKLYGEENSVGPATAPIIARAVMDAINGDSATVHFDNRSLRINLPALLLLLLLAALMTLLFRRHRKKKGRAVGSSFVTSKKTMPPR